MAKPEGILIAIGGNEEKDFPKIDEKYQSEFGEGGILHYIIKHAGGSESRIEVITSATIIPGVVGKKYEETFHRLGAENIGILDIRDREFTDAPENLKRIEAADAILFSGGDQSQITRYIRNTRMHELILDRYRNEKLVIAGTSAGAVVMAEEMITGGRNANVLRKNDLKMGKGLGLMKEVVFDSHFIRRGRFGRLAEAAARHPDKLGIGLGEDTGVIITEGDICEIIGSGMVVLFDGSTLNFNQYHNLKDDMAVSLANLTVHVMATGDKFYIREKKAQIHDNPLHQNKDVEEVTRSE